MSRRRVFVVPHTHWDREWYQPFQTFRLRLVELLDDLVPRLEADPSFTRFLLDGQMAVVDDYLAIRPEAADAIRRLAASGRVAMGPWYILSDEFLVSGETLIRNLQMGIERAACFGGAMEVGYLPDMFGHIAQMPQILKLCGFEHAVVWRGVPGQIDRTAFWWSAPDGSTVRAEYLVCGYGNGSSIPDDAKVLLRRIAAHEEEIESFLCDGILFMNGTDHERPQPWLGRVVAEVNQIQDYYELIISSLPEYLDSAPTEGIPRWKGELRSGARANLLMGVTSNRVDVRTMAARAEQVLERQAEPLCALYLPPERWPDRFLDIAWKQVIRNSAHDSVCACSLDEVVMAVLDRYAEARHIGEDLTQRALDAIAESMATPGPVIVNPSAKVRAGVVELIVAGDKIPEGAQGLPIRRPPTAEISLSVDELRSILGMIREQQIGARTFVNNIELIDGAEGFQVTIHADSTPRPNVIVEELKRELYARLGAAPDIRVTLSFEIPPRRRVAAYVDPVPGFGWTTFEPVPLDHPVRIEGSQTGPIITNGRVTVAIEEATGTFSVNGIAGFDRLVDGGDYGDTYNYSPPTHDAIIDGPEKVATEVLEAGPVRAKVRMERQFRWPERIDPVTRARTGEREVTMSTIVEVRAAEELVRIETSFENPCRDHRLRALFPLPSPSAVSQAECAFAVVERGLEAEGGPHERGLATFPARRFARAGGLTVLHEGVREYELVEISDGLATALALTLLRATGVISQVEVEMAYRPVPAGPSKRLRDSQMLGPVVARYALHVDTGGSDGASPDVASPDVADPYKLADDFLLPLSVIQAEGGGQRSTRGSSLSVSGAEVSCLRRVTGALELRVFNPTERPTTVTIDGRSGWLVDLRGRPLAAFESHFHLDPWAIAIARLSD